MSSRRHVSLTALAKGILDVRLRVYTDSSRALVKSSNDALGSQQLEIEESMEKEHGEFSIQFCLLSLDARWEMPWSRWLGPWSTSYLSTNGPTLSVNTLCRYRANQAASDVPFVCWRVKTLFMT